MNRILLFCLLLSFTIAVTAQYADTTRYSLPTNYLQKSKNQRTVGWIMLGGGGLLTVIGLAVTAKDLDELFGVSQGNNDATGEVLIYSGLAVMAGSIPFFISAGKNRRKAAAAVSFKMENATYINQLAVSARHYPAIGIKFRL